VLLLDVGDEFHVEEQVGQEVDLEWFSEDMVHSGVNGLLDVVLLNVSGDSKNAWLILSWNVEICPERTHHLGSFITIEEWHVAVGQDKCILKWITTLGALLDDLVGLLTVSTEGNFVAQVVHLKDFEECLKNIKVVLLVIDYKDLASLMCFTNKLDFVQIAFNVHLWDFMVHNAGYVGHGVHHLTVSFGFLGIDDLVLVFKEDAERKLGADIFLGPHTDHSIECFDNLLADDEAKTDTLVILMLDILDTTKQFEQLDSLHVGNAYSSICDRHDDFVTLLIRNEDFLKIVVLIESDLLGTDVTFSNTLVLAVVVFKVDKVLGHISVNFSGGNVFRLSPNVLADNVDLAVVLGELESVGLKVSQDLLKSELISVNHHGPVIKVANFFPLVHLLTASLWEPIEMSVDGDVFGVSLVLLNVSNILNASVNIETLDVLEESAGLDLGETEEVLDVEAQFVTGGAADLVAFHNLLVEFVKFSEKFGTDHTLNLGDIREELLTEHADDFTLVHNNVKWVSHFVRNSRIDEADKLLLSLNGVVG
jgi:hypothetical protein